MREARSVRDIYLPELGEFGFEAKRYEGLLKHQLGLPSSRRLDWTEKVETQVKDFLE
jgi:hypothetical protein